VGAAVKVMRGTGRRTTAEDESLRLPQANLGSAACLAAGPLRTLVRVGYPDGTVGSCWSQS
jgi:hypothetical protein